MPSEALLQLRPLDHEHLAPWRDWVNDPEIASFLDRVLPVTSDEHARFYQTAVVDNRSAVWFALHTITENRYIGNVWLWNINHRHAHAEVRILIGNREFWQRGAGTEALHSISNYAFDKLGLHKIYAYVMARNPRARAAFEKVGFSLEATHSKECYWEGAFHDVWRFARLRSDRH